MLLVFPVLPDAGSFLQHKMRKTRRKNLLGSWGGIPVPSPGTLQLLWLIYSRLLFAAGGGVEESTTGGASPLTPPTNAVLCQGNGRGDCSLLLIPWP